MGRPQIRPVKAGLITAMVGRVGRFQDWSADNRTCLARRPRIRQERGIYPAGTPARQIRAWKFQRLLRRPIFLRTKVRAPFARPANTLNTYQEGSNTVWPVPPWEGSNSGWPVPLLGGVRG